MQATRHLIGILLLQAAGCLGAATGAETAETVATERRPPEAVDAGMPASRDTSKETPSAPVRMQQRQKAAGTPAAQTPLALAALEQRLKDTDAIGLFTKIALKNQIDDLLDRIKSHHQGNGNTTLAQLRQSYDQLLARIYELLKEGDPALAGTIMTSREAIWSVITDPLRFAKL